MSSAKPANDEEKRLIRDQVDSLGYRMLGHGVLFVNTAVAVSAYGVGSRWLRIPIQSACLVAGLGHIGAGCMFLSLFPWVHMDKVSKLQFGNLEAAVIGPGLCDGHMRPASGYVKWSVGKYAVSLSS